MRDEYAGKSHSSLGRQSIPEQLAVSSMNDKPHPTPAIQNYALLMENQRKLAEYIETSLWDEEMNRRREYWLWERKDLTHQSEHY